MRCFGVSNVSVRTLMGALPGLPKADAPPNKGRQDLLPQQRETAPALSARHESTTAEPLNL